MTCEEELIFLFTSLDYVDHAQPEVPVLGISVTNFGCYWDKAGCADDVVV